MDSDRAMVNYAKALLDEGYRVELGRTGVAELITISDVFISDESGMIVITPAGSAAENRILMAPEQLAVVNAVHGSGPGRP